MPFPLLVSGGDGGDGGRRGASWGNCSNSVERMVLPARGREEIVVGEEKLFLSSLLGYLACLQIKSM
uniref:Uncharacterized protein n=1 Tax=Cebus imitator TaxID=2715852 RepID=A0A2K5Q5F8_CEBIM